MIALAVWLGLAGPVWALLGSSVVPRHYRRAGLDPRLAGYAGALGGAAFGPLAVVPLWRGSRRLRPGRDVGAPALVLVLELLVLFRLLDPTNPCVRDGGYVANQVQNGLTVGAVFATIAVGLTLIYSVIGIVSFSHGQFVMLGGVVSYLLLTGPVGANALVAIPIVGVLAFALGALVELTLLSPMRHGRVERRDEYAILITFGFGIFLQYVLLGSLGPTAGIEAPRYTARPLLGLDTPAFGLGPLRLRTDLLIAGGVGVVLVVLLGLFLQRTWTGRSLRAVSMNPQAAAIVGIDSGRAITFAFALGSMLAGMAGAALVPVLAFPIPDFASQAAVTSYVIIVLGGLGSVLGSFLGGLFIGVVEALGAGCYPDPSRGAAYQVAFALVIFAVVLLVRPQGFFGRR